MVKCAISGCDRKAEKKLMCQMHYRREWRKNNQNKNKAIIKRSKDKQKEINGHWRDKQVICPVCRVVFTKTGPNHKYCTTKCQNKLHFKRKMKNLQYKLRHNLRSRLRKTLHGKAYGLSPVRDLGCTVNELKTYLESKWHPGMSWKNYGLYGWHIDHIKSLNSFDLNNRIEFLRACHYTNLQPLWAADNLKKGFS